MEGSGLAGLVQLTVHMTYLLVGTGSKSRFCSAGSEAVQQYEVHWQWLRSTGFFTIPHKLEKRNGKLNQHICLWVFLFNILESIEMNNICILFLFSIYIFISQESCFLIRTIEKGLVFTVYCLFSFLCCGRCRDTNTKLI